MKYHLIKEKDCAMCRLEACFAVELHQHNWQRKERGEQEVKFRPSELDGAERKMRFGGKLCTGNSIQILSIARIAMLPPVIFQVEA